MARFILFLLFLSECLFLQASDQDSPNLRVMSFNIRNSFARDGENHWEGRKEQVYQPLAIIYLESMIALNTLNLADLDPSGLQIQTPSFQYFK